MIRRGEGQVRRSQDLEQSVRKAYHEAVEDFREQYKRLPNYDVVAFRGAFTTHRVVFEIEEEEDR